MLSPCHTVQPGSVLTPTQPKDATLAYLRVKNLEVGLKRVFELVLKDQRTSQQNLFGLLLRESHAFGDFHLVETDLEK